MTKEQIDWAMQHDWAVSRVRNGVLVVDTAVSSDGKVTSFRRIFTDFRKLRIWAGY